ncbi:MAG: HesA/MoeB/ThiF family protein [Muribaculum sp.]|uniref:HesA/MoeB/ThiF family protein n=1 Tax=Candidatus Merdivivens faecigallinarum TaxID=2840871 RepID=A0A9D9IZQ3_9BACT|nr:HesA/MoeB/ThiF family protein [Candidatus Merdivivens faecigallinarum]
MKNRYDRQKLLSGFGDKGQEALERASVLIIGAGGLGSPASLYLAGAGIGRLGIADGDTVNPTNLHRQILYDESKCGMNKAECAAERLRNLNSGITITPYPFMLNRDNAMELISGYDIVIDGCDNFPTRYLVSGICERLGKPYVYGAVSDTSGFVSVLCLKDPAKGRMWTYRDLFPEGPSAGELSAVSKAVLGPVPGITGCCQAAEAIKLICGIGTSLCGRLWIYDALSGTSDTVEL